MAIKKRFCPTCRCAVVAEAPGTSHLFHLVLTLLTAGLWLIVWIIAAGSKKWVCRECGTVTAANVVSLWLERAVIGVFLLLAFVVAVPLIMYAVKP